ncbi:hypothetical protein THRCLA_01299 [Thraustotheca clavata]|uniref:MSP domain-containing protein n=1 Tax=Thraustotheca clavata TaxID=74557 RepID=A0A1W0A8Q7_9STRA|nr:hypothetical protein THRCLA_01299 [Thraustotheca clavata]
MTTPTTIQDYLNRYEKEQKQRVEAGRRTVSQEFGLDDGDRVNCEFLLNESDGDIAKYDEKKCMLSNVIDDTHFIDHLLDSPLAVKPKRLLYEDISESNMMSKRDSLESLFAPQDNLASQATLMNFDKEPINLDTERFVDAATFLSQQDALLPSQNTRPELNSDTTTWTNSSGFRSPDDFFAERSRDLSHVEFGDGLLSHKNSLMGSVAEGPLQITTKSHGLHKDFAPLSPTNQTVYIAAAPRTTKESSEPLKQTTSATTQEPLPPKYTSQTLPQPETSTRLTHVSYTPQANYLRQQSEDTSGIVAPFLDLSISQSTPIKDLVPHRQAPQTNSEQPLSISTYLQNSLVEYANRPNIESMTVNIDEEPFKVVSDAVQAAMSLTSHEREIAQWKEPIHPSHVIHSSLDAVAAVQAMMEATGHMQQSVSEVLRLREQAKQAIEAAVVSEAMAIADYHQRTQKQRPRTSSQQYERQAIDNITAEITSAALEPTQPNLPPPRRSSRASMQALKNTANYNATSPQANGKLHQTQANSRLEEADRSSNINGTRDTPAPRQRGCFSSGRAEPKVVPSPSKRSNAQQRPREFGLSPIRFQQSGAATPELSRNPSQHTISEEDRKRLHGLLAPNNTPAADMESTLQDRTAMPNRLQSRRSFREESHNATDTKPKLRIDTNVPRSSSSYHEKKPSSKMHRDDLQTAFSEVENYDTPTQPQRYTIQQHNKTSEKHQDQNLMYKEVPMSPPPTPYSKALERPKLCKRFLCTLGGEISETFVFRNTSPNYARICASIVPLSRGCNQFQIIPTVLEMPPHASDHFVIRFIASQVGAVSGIFQFRSMSGDPLAMPYEIIVDAHVKKPSVPPPQLSPPSVIHEEEDNGECLVDVHPTYIRLETSSQTKSFEVINYSDKAIPFSIACPYSHISIAPTQGIVRPKSKSSVTVLCNTSSSVVAPNKKSWCGSFSITLDGSLTREISVVVDASPMNKPPTQPDPKSSQLSQSSTTSSSRTNKKRSKRTLFFQAENMDCGTTSLHTSQCVPVRICNGTKEPMTVFVQPLERPFSCAYSSLTLRPRSYVEVPVVFTPEKHGEVSVPMIVHSSSQDKAILILHGRTSSN